MADDPDAGPGRGAGQVPDPAAEPEAPLVVETHVSVLLLGDGRVLKFKKPVRYPFVDLSTAAGRRHACEAEVAGNRRLSPDVYLGVADVVLEGEVLDHAVVMRRLPARRNLAALVADPHVDVAPQLEQLVQVLVGFHRRALRSAAIDAAGSVEHQREVWAGALAELRPRAGTVVSAASLAEVERLARRFLDGRGALLRRRVRDGWVCDGHGDLLATDVFLLPDGPRILDCLEFDPRLRHGDVLADLAFLLMDLERLGAQDAARLLQRSYEQAVGDPFPPALVHHYVAQRATIRAEVACLRAEQGGPGADTAAALLQLALEHLRAGRVVLGVISGLPGTGKSAAAATAGRRLGWPVLRSDAVRRRLVGDGEVAEADRYSPQATAAVYRRMLRQAEAELAMGRSVLLDATFGDPRWRQQVEALAFSSASDLVAVECTCPAPVAAQRIRRRRQQGDDLSEADEQVAAALAASTVPWAAAHRVDTARRSVDAVGQTVVDLVESVTHRAAAHTAAS